MGVLFLLEPFQCLKIEFLQALDLLLIVILKIVLYGAQSHALLLQENKA